MCLIETEKIGPDGPIFLAYEQKTDCVFFFLDKWEHDASMYPPQFRRPAHGG